MLEYENCLLVNPELSEQLGRKVEFLKTFLNPEERIIKICLEKGGVLYSTGDYRKSNKYFTRVLSLSNEEDFEYKLAKSRIVNV